MYKSITLTDGWPLTVLNLCLVSVCHESDRSEEVLRGWTRFSRKGGQFIDQSEARIHSTCCDIISIRRCAVYSHRVLWSRGFIPVPWEKKWQIIGWTENHRVVPTDLQCPRGLKSTFDHLLLILGFFFFSSKCTVKIYWTKKLSLNLYVILDWHYSNEIWYKIYEFW